MATPLKLVREVLDSLEHAGFDYGEIITDWGAPVKDVEATYFPEQRRKRLGGG
jgi:hypothetical protein